MTTLNSSLVVLTVHCKDVRLYHVLVPVGMASVVPGVDQLQPREVQRAIHEHSDVL